MTSHENKEYVQGDRKVQLSYTLTPVYAFAETANNLPNLIRTHQNH